MKANLIVITFIFILAVITFQVSSFAVSNNIDNVNYQQLELHKAVLAKKQLETLAKYNQVEINKEALEASFADIDTDEAVVELTIKEDVQMAEGMVIKRGTVVHWVNEGMFHQVLSLENSAGEVNNKFGKNVLRAGDRFYYRFDEAADWVLINSNANGNCKCAIKVE